MKDMKAWRIQFLCFLVFGAAVQYVTSVEEELADSIFGELPIRSRPPSRSSSSMSFMCSCFSADKRGDEAEKRRETLAPLRTAFQC